jgi:hypothetical protein
MNIWARSFLILASLLITLIQPVSSQQNRTQPPSETTPQPRDYLDVPVNIEAPVHPIPVKASDGKLYLVYHLFLTNWSFADLMLKNVEVFDEERGKILVTYGERELSDLYRFRAVLPTPSRLQVSSLADLRRIAAGRTAALFFWLAVDDERAVPLTLKHRLTFEENPLIRLRRGAASEGEAEMVLDGFRLGVSRERAIAIGAPLRGGSWRCGNGPAYNTAHQYLDVRDGKVRNAQRFAIDFQRVDQQGNVLPNPFPDSITNNMFYGYGAEVLAVADGVVAFVKDGIPENTPLASGEISPAVPITGETVSGNWISIDLGRGRYAFYAHLQPNSIRVRVGDRVRRGQVIGLLGNSGNAVGPHLHFHIGDANSLNGSEGLPFVFESFEIVGQTHRHVREIPLNNSIIQFP